MRKFSEQEKLAREQAYDAKQQAVLAESTDPNRLTCLICGWHAMNTIQKHLERKHDRLTPTQYKAMFSVGAEAIYGVKLRKGLSDKVTGDKNPAYQHGGRLSPFSKKFVKYTDEAQAAAGIAAVGDKVRTAQLDHGNTKLNHYLAKGLTQAEAESALTDRQQTFTIDKCVERHGELEGKRIWTERQERWQATLNDKPLDEIERINNSKIWKSGGVSKQSVSLFEKLNYMNARWSGQGGEVCIKMMLKGKPKHKMADFVIEKKIIEYFGTYWHADPRKYPNNDLLLNKRTGPVLAGDVRADDQEYIDGLKLLGYEVLVIWEADYMANPTEIIQKCNDFLAS